MYYFPNQPPNQPSNQPPLLRNPSVYEDAQVLIAVGIVRKTWIYLSVGLVFFASILTWMGYDFRKNRNVLLGEIRESQEELETEIENANVIISKIENKLKSQTDQEDRLKERLNYLNGQIALAQTLPNEYLKTIANQSEAFGKLTEKNNQQLETAKSTLSNISRADSDLINDRESLTSALGKFEQLQNGLDQRLVFLENKVNDRWDEVIRTKEQNKIIPRLGLKLKFDTIRRRFINEKYTTMGRYY